MRFQPLTPARLVHALADWVLRCAEGTGRLTGTVVGFDGPAESGVTDLADATADALRGSGRPVIRASTCWWWRPSALRLELGREDVDMLLTGWLDAGALCRELVQPVLGNGPTYITRLRDPVTDRSVRERPSRVTPGAILLLDGPFLLAAELPLAALVGFRISRGALNRALDDDRKWWTAAYERYERSYSPADRADVLISYDHRSAPAVSGLARTGG